MTILLNLKCSFTGYLYANKNKFKVVFIIYGFKMTFIIVFNFLILKF